ncbi:MAG: hypothetical protein ABIQ52_10190 [Vicinamibacterales bacterium]
MNRCTLFVVFFLALTTPGFAADDGFVSGPATAPLVPSRTVLTAITREAARVTLARHGQLTSGRASAVPISTQPPRSWIGRHPCVLGTLVGVAAGSTIAAATWGREGAFVGFYGGGTAGWIVGKVIAGRR